MLTVDKAVICREADRMVKRLRDGLGDDEAECVFFEFRRVLDSEIFKIRADRDMRNVFSKYVEAQSVPPAGKKSWVPRIIQGGPA